MLSILTPAEVSRASGCAVVIDVMRAFTVTAWAFHLGAEKIVLLRELSDALALKVQTPGSLAFQDGPPISGFDLANSPVQIEQLDLAGRTIYQRTTSGTQGALAASHCQPLICTGFTTARATAAFLKRECPDEYHFVPTGEAGRATEDVACAEYIQALVEDATISGLPYIETARASRSAQDLRSRVQKGTAGTHQGDVERCLDANRFDFVMIASMEDGLLTLRRSR
jgi:2-phosphosulfolactate phosphatase